MRHVSILLLSLALTGCTAAKATYHLVEAQQAVTRAESHRAPELAVYEYTLASRYLAKAEEEAGSSQFRTSVELSRLSSEWSDKAIIAIEEEGRGLDLSAEDVPDQALPELADDPLAPDELDDATEPADDAEPDAEPDAWDLPDEDDEIEIEGGEVEGELLPEAPPPAENPWGDP